MRASLQPTDPHRLGEYRLEARLGQGGMGTVYLGYAPSGRPVAIKVIKPEFASDPHFRARFRSEVNRARQVPSFCTAELLDADADHTTPYLVVEYVDGPSLSEVVRKQGPLTGGNLYSVAVGVATALAAIHGAGVIHRDLKPDNVLFAMGNPKVIDFGIARAFEATSQHTGTDQMVGTVGYMAPERFDAATDRTVGPAADVFAWGVLVTYAGTGRLPFGGDSAAATAAAILTQPPQLNGLPEPLRDLVGRALEKDPAHRPSAAQLLEMLLAAGTEDFPRPEVRRAAQAMHRAGSPGTSSRRWRRVAPVLAAVAVVVAAVGALGFTSVGDGLFDPEAAGTASSSAGPALSSGPVAGSKPAEAAPVESASASAPATVKSGGPVVVEPAPTAAPVRFCRTSDTTITVTAQNDDPTALGTQKGLISIVNGSGSSCRLDGRVRITIYNPADELIEVPTKNVDEPGEAVEMLLKPGGGAFQGMKWQACDRDECPAGSTMRGSLERSGAGEVVELESFPDQARPSITMSSLQLGTLQPSRQGVVAW